MTYDWCTRSESEVLGIGEDIQVTHCVLVGLAGLLLVPAAAQWREPLVIPTVVVDWEFTGIADVVRKISHSGTKYPYNS